jgi:hypothetical protein
MLRLSRRGLPLLKRRLTCDPLSDKEVPGMAGIIEVDSRGGPPARFIEKSIYALRDEYAKAGIKIRTLLLESVPPSPQVVIGIITPVPPELIVKLIDIVLKAQADLEKLPQSTPVKIFITHQEGGIRFHIPDDRKKCEKYFASLAP